MSYDNILSLINTDIFNDHPLYTVDKNLRNFKTKQVSVVLSADMALDLGVDIEDQTFSMMRNELIQSFDRDIVSKIFNTKKFDYLDIISDGGLAVSPYTTIRKILDMIALSGREYKNIITTGMVASVLQDCSEFHVESTGGGKISSGSSIYKVGRLLNLDVWVDPFLKYSDNRIVLFNDIGINIYNISSSIQSQATFAPRLVLQCDFAFDVGDSKVIFIIDNESSDSFRQYKSLQRDIKIDGILDEEK